MFGRKSLKDVAEDMVLEIQLRLPVKSLLRFACVCKAWCARCRDQEFVYAHHRKHEELDHSKTLVTCPVSPLLDSFYHGTNSYRFTELKVEEENDNVEIVRVMDNILNYPTNPPNVHGPCNGLLCLQTGDQSNNDNDRLALWNPATREYKLLPDFLYEPPPKNPFDIQFPLTTVVAFGYDSRTDDYKIIKHSGSYTKFHDLTEIYSLRENSWKKSWFQRDFSSVLPNSIFLDGKCHFRDRKYNNEVIVSWDMDESFIETKLPYGYKNKVWEPTTYNNYFTAIFWNGNKARPLEIWVLKEIGVKESWVQQYIIDPWGSIEASLGIWKDKKLFFRHEGSPLFYLALYDLKTQEIKTSNIWGQFNEFQIINYVESLVSIDGKPDHKEIYVRHNIQIETEVSASTCFHQEVLCKPKPPAHEEGLSSSMQKTEAVPLSNRFAVLAEFS